MKRFILIFLVVCSLFCFYAPFSFAGGFVDEPQLVNSPMSYPSPSAVRNGLNITYTEYYVNQSYYQSATPQNTLYRMIFTIPHYENVILRLDGNQKVCINTTYSETITYRITQYDLNTGVVIDDYTETSSTDINYLLSGYSQVLFFRRGYLVLEEGLYGSQDAFGYPISNLKKTQSSIGNTSEHAWDTNTSPYVNWSKESYTVLQFVNDIFGLPERYSFIGYIVGGVLILILLDGLINFLFGSINDLTSRRKY